MLFSICDMRISIIKKNAVGFYMFELNFGDTLYTGSSHLMCVNQLVFEQQPGQVDKLGVLAAGS